MPRNFAVLMPVLLLCGCVSAAARQQYEAGEQETRVDFVVPATLDAVYGRAMAALIEQGYTVRTAEKDAGLIVTGPKYSESSALVGAFIGGSGKRATVLTINALPQTQDVRVVISGTWQWEGATNAFSKAEEPITANHPEWLVMQAVAEAIRLAGASTVPPG